MKLFEYLKKFLSSKFLLAVLAVIASIVLCVFHFITGQQFVSIIQVVVPAYMAGNVAASYAQPPPSITPSFPPSVVVETK